MKRHIVGLALRGIGDRKFRSQFVNHFRGETLAGLEIVEEVRSGRKVRLSRTDADFIDRHRFLEYGSPGFMGPPWFAALRACLEERRGYKIRKIEIHGMQPGPARVGGRGGLWPTTLTVEAQTMGKASVARDGDCRLGQGGNNPTHALHSAPPETRDWLRGPATEALKAHNEIEREFRKHLI